MESLESLLLLSTTPAFPGAYGFGAGATGGRGGPVYVVTNLNDAGPGSFRDAVSRPHRIVDFGVGGSIVLKSAVSVARNVTIEGQTAPGDGIGVVGNEVSFSGSSNDIVRYIRFRQGTNDPDGHHSGINLGKSHDMILDHVSIEFARYDSIDAVGASNVTVQDSIIADPIGQQFGAHVEGGPITFYGDVWANAHNRQPLAKSDTQFVNNVVYNYQAGYTVADTSGSLRHDIIDNIFVAGTATSKAGDAFFQMNSRQSVYSRGNVLDGNKDGVLNGTRLGNLARTTPLAAPWSPLSATLPTTDASAAYAYDLANAGDSLHRDAVGSLVIGQVATLGKGPTGTGRGTAGPGRGLYTSQAQDGLPGNGYGTP